MARENGTHVVGVIANRDYRVDGPSLKLLEVLGPMSGQVQANLPHHLKRHRMHISGGLRSGTSDINEIARRLAQNSLGHLTTTLIPRAEYQYQRVHVAPLLSLNVLSL